MRSTIRPFEVNTFEVISLGVFLVFNFKDKYSKQGISFLKDIEDTFDYD